MLTAVSGLNDVNIIVTLFVLAGGAIAAFSVILSRRTENARDLQNTTISSLEGSITSLEADGRLKDSKIASLEKQVESYVKQTAALTDDMHRLQELALQAAKVDNLRDEVNTRFDEMSTKLDSILSRGPRATPTRATRDNPTDK